MIQSNGLSSSVFFFLPTFRINGLDLIGGLAGHAGAESVEGSDSVGVPLAFRQTRHLELQIRHQVTAGLPLVGSSLAAVYVVTTDTGATVVLWWLPGQEDAAGRLVSPPQVLWRIGNS